MVTLDVATEMKSSMMQQVMWRSMAPEDLEEVHAIAEKVHPDYPERIEVFQERLRLYPHGCYVLELDDVMSGYVISHPWHPMLPPKLDSLVVAMPTFPATFYIHDLALMDKVRGTGAGSAAVRLLLEHAEVIGLSDASLVAVNASVPFWQKHGFSAIENEAITAALASYGNDACFMMRELDASVVL